MWLGLECPLTHTRLGQLTGEATYYSQQASGISRERRKARGILSHLSSSRLFNFLSALLSFVSVVTLTSPQSFTVLCNEAAFLMQRFS